MKLRASDHFFVLTSTHYAQVKSCVNAGILALVIHEKIQERAYAEIVAVVGRDRLPNADDRASLPFIEAFVREVYRFYPPVPLGMCAAPRIGLIVCLT